jgi:hypothetical protein
MSRSWNPHIHSPKGAHEVLEINNKKETSFAFLSVSHLYINTGPPPLALYGILQFLSTSTTKNKQAPKNLKIELNMKCLW